MVLVQVDAIGRLMLILIKCVHSTVVCVNYEVVDIHYSDTFFGHM